MSGLGGFLFGNIDEEGKLDNEDFDEELKANLTIFSEKIQGRKLLGLDTLISEDLSAAGGSPNTSANTEAASEGNLTVENKRRDDKMGSARSAASSFSHPMTPLPDAINFEDITELAVEDPRRPPSTVSNVLTDASDQVVQQQEALETASAFIPTLFEEVQPEGSQVVPFNSRQILKFTRLSAQPSLINATGRSYSRYSVLRKLRLKRKLLLHAKHIHLCENQLETFLSRTGTVAGVLSPAAARLRLSLIHLSSPAAQQSSTATVSAKPSKPWFQSSRYRALEHAIQTAALESSFEESSNTAVPTVNLPANSAFHPINLYPWENSIKWDDIELAREANVLSDGMYIDINSSASTTTPSFTAVAGTPQQKPSITSTFPGAAAAASSAGANGQLAPSLSTILSSLSMSGSSSGLGTDSATATALLALIRNQQLRSASLAASQGPSQVGSLRSLTPSGSLSRTSSSGSITSSATLKFPRSRAARVLNRELESGDWLNSIIWDPRSCDPTQLLTHLVLPMDDPQLIFTPVPVENLNKKLNRAERLISKRLKKLRTVNSESTFAALTSFSRPIADKFNISNDKYYEASSASSTADSGIAASSATGKGSGGQGHASGSRSGHHAEAPGVLGTASQLLASTTIVGATSSGSPTLQHTISALKLAPPAFHTCQTKRELRLWHRPRVQIPLGGCLFNSWARVRPNSLKKHHSMHSALQRDSRTSMDGSLSVEIAANPSVGIIRNSRKLSLKDSAQFVIFEYSEEFPPLLLNAGMSSYLVLFYRRKSPQDPWKPRSLVAQVHVLEFTDPSPFWMFGDVPAGGMRYALCNGLFRAPVFPHPTSTCDFLVGLSAQDDAPHSGTAQVSAYVRPLASGQVFCVGQQFPVVEVPGPHSRRHNLFCRQRLQVAAYRLFNKDIPLATGPNANRKRLKIARLLATFPQFSEGSIRKWLKEYAESTRAGKDSGLWMLREDAPQLEEDELRSLVSPEAVCQYEAMLAGQQFLTDSDVLSFDPLNANSAAADDLEEGDSFEVEDATKAAKRKSGIAVSPTVALAPWNMTANFMNAVQNRMNLALTGLGDPSGRNEAFSFLKSTNAAGAGSNTAASTTTATAATTTATSNAEYRQELNRTWEAQLAALSKGNTTSPSTASSQSTGTSYLRQAAPFAKLKISRRLTTDSSQWIHEEIQDPVVIAAYLKIRMQSSSAALAEKKGRRGFSAPDVLPLINKAPVSNVSSHKTSQPPHKSSTSKSAAKRPAFTSTSQKAEKNLQIRCGACGQVGHMRTNRICPLFQDPSSQTSAQSTASQGSVQPLKLKIKFSVSEGDGSIAEGTDKPSGAPASSASSASADSSDSIYPSPVLLPSHVRAKGPPIPSVHSAIKRSRRLTPKQRHAQFLATQSVEVRAKLAQLSTCLIAQVDNLMALPTTLAFHRPVPRRLYPLYYQHIKRPIDLSTIRNRATNLDYSNSSGFIEDFQLLLANCSQFNGPESPLSDVARDMLQRTQAALAEAPEVIEINLYLQANLIPETEANHAMDADFQNTSEEVSIVTDVSASEAEVDMDVDQDAGAGAGVTADVDQDAENQTTSSSM